MAQAAAAGGGVVGAAVNLGGPAAGPGAPPGPGGPPGGVGGPAPLPPALPFFPAVFAKPVLSPSPGPGSMVVAYRAATALDYSRRRGPTDYPAAVDAAVYEAGGRSVTGGGALALYEYALAFQDLESSMTNTHQTAWTSWNNWPRNKPDPVFVGVPAITLRAEHGDGLLSIQQAGVHTVTNFGSTPVVAGHNVYWTRPQVLQRRGPGDSTTNAVSVSGLVLRNMLTAGLCSFPADGGSDAVDHLRAMAKLDTAAAAKMQELGIPPLPGAPPAVDQTMGADIFLKSRKVGRALGDAAPGEYFSLLIACMH